MDISVFGLIILGLMLLGGGIFLRLIHGESKNTDDRLSAKNGLYFLSFISFILMLLPPIVFYYVVSAGDKYIKEDFDTKLEIACKLDLSDEEIKDEIEDIISEDLKDYGYSDLKIEIEDEDISGGKIKNVKFSFKKHYILKGLYDLEGYSLKIIFNNDTSNRVKIYE